MGEIDLLLGFSIEIGCGFGLGPAIADLWRHS